MATTVTDLGNVVGPEGPQPELENTLTSTSTTKALSAAMGKNLQDQITNLQNSMKTMILAAFPVGTIIQTSNSSNPSTYLGGTWEQYSPGRVLVGAGTGTDGNGSAESFNVGATGGEYYTNKVANHKHNLTVDRTDSEAQGYGLTGATTFQNRVLVSRDVPSSKLVSNNVNGVDRVSNKQPYRVVYFWRRTL